MWIWILSSIFIIILGVIVGLWIYCYKIQKKKWDELLIQKVDTETELDNTKEEYGKIIKSKDSEIAALKVGLQGYKMLDEQRNQTEQQYLAEVAQQIQKLTMLKDEESIIGNTITGRQQELKEINRQIEGARKELAAKLAECQRVESFEKNSFGDEMPYIDFADYFEKNNFGVVLKLLDDAIELAPQLKTELKKIEWSLCYLPYKKKFIRDFSRPGIYALEVKREYESKVLDELELKRINDAGSLVYIGQATDIYDRWTTHIKKMLGIESAGGEKLYKFTPLMFKWRALEWCDRDKLNNLDEREAYWINWFNSEKFGLNSKGGNK